VADIQAGLAEVRLWDGPPAGDPPAGARRVARHGALPMVRPLGEWFDPRGWTAIPRGIWI